MVTLSRAGKVVPVIQNSTMTFVPAGTFRAVNFCREPPLNSPCTSGWRLPSKRAAPIRTRADHVSGGVAGD